MVFGFSQVPQVWGDGWGDSLIPGWWCVSQSTGTTIETDTTDVSNSNTELASLKLTCPNSGDVIVMQSNPIEIPRAIRMPGGVFGTFATESLVKQQTAHSGQAEAALFFCDKLGGFLGAPVLFDTKDPDTVWTPAGRWPMVGGVDIDPAAVGMVFRLSWTATAGPAVAWFSRPRYGLYGAGSAGKMGSFNPIWS